ncbi:MAG TPA: hypothetical protein VIJ06_03010 [Methylovirgula sp.]
MKRIAKIIAIAVTMIGPGFAIQSGHAQEAPKPDLTAAGIWLEWYRSTEVVIWKIQEVDGEFVASVIKTIQPSPGRVALDVIKPEEGGRFEVRHLKRHGLVYDGGELLSPHGRVADLKITLSPDGQTAAMDESNFGSIVDGVRKPDADAQSESSGLARIE